MAGVSSGGWRSWSDAGLDKATDKATEVHVSRHEDGVVELRLVGPARRNALARSTLERLEGLVSVPPLGTRVIVLTAEGPDFCAGYDLREAARGDPEGLIANGANFALLQQSRVPIIAALHGNVIGGGLELALAADVRLTTPNVKFAIPAGRLGLVYSEQGVRLLVNEVGESRARAMLLAGRALTAEEAMTSGIVSEIVEPDRLSERALELASLIASWSPAATSGNRRVIDAVVGRIDEDTESLRRASFQPHGTLARNIEQFASDGSVATMAAFAIEQRLFGTWMTVVRATGSRFATAYHEHRGLRLSALVGDSIKQRVNPK